MAQGKGGVSLDSVAGSGLGTPCVFSSIKSPVTVACPRVTSPSAAWLVCALKHAGESDSNQPKDKFIYTPVKLSSVPGRPFRAEVQLHPFPTFPELLFAPGWLPPFALSGSVSATGDV